MKTSYVALRRIQIAAQQFYVEKSDILTFSSANTNTLTVYRNQAIVKTLPFTQGGLDALAKVLMIQPIVAAVTPTHIAEGKPAPKPAPVVHVKTKPLHYRKPKEQ